MGKMTPNNIFKIENLEKKYGERKVVDIKNIYVNNGDFFVIVGPSGAGKSTFLRLLKYLEEPTNGDIYFEGKKLSNPLDVNIQRNISMVFQRPEFLKRSVFENVEFPLWIRGKKDNEKVEKVLGQVDIGNLIREKTSSLSGGELQRLALARAMVVDPKVLLLDEPTANLDPYNVELIEKIVLNLNKAGKTIVMVTHNVFQAKRLASSAGLLLNGKLVEVGSADTFFNTPKDARVKDFLEGRMVY
jgi:tungstate transport system ATP-binding protein